MEAEKPMPAGVDGEGVTRPLSSGSGRGKTGRRSAGIGMGLSRSLEVGGLVKWAHFNARKLIMMSPDRSGYVMISAHTGRP